MIKKLKQSFETLTTWKQLAIVLFLNTLNFFIVSYLVFYLFDEFIWPDDESKSFSSLLFVSVFMGVLFTLMLHFKKVRNLFKKKKDEPST